MKWYQQLLIGIYSLAALYFLYQGVLHLIAYFLNKSNGQQDSFFETGRLIAIGGVLSFFAAGAYYFVKNPSEGTIGSFLLYFPLVILVVFVIWTIILIISSGGRWN
ncbi:MAG: hypothetical protein IPN36_02340 [Bacteroidetes bacterium]|nr:hypothetical protein [Bacteroidota bacterium]MBL0096040.1 hypothetical protein [Bacteroidota bacterium]